MSAELVDFLKARLDEDEQTALDWQRHKQALTEQYTADPKRQHVRPFRTRVTDAQVAEYAHASRFDPARVLREVEAKRRILALHKECDARCYIVQVLAVPYDDHPDYRAEWRP
ncbi:hypothetical protein Ssi03_25720 [Sphaerisporangium siamense]|uniref:Uncharacterized protein n=1 Tax=Sphaerisporangium siamense TaxID=795645 RepID=A0A7W7G8B4_9ACTN|nr:DUF6221 family protein [Sphaerisporangium siamense]MBB4700102.1 hypothetical protein [Sphaerisporangium siamense]GII84582.1 hypothetical protein Ssi03_25720 [Sphaerisporangium siamense]